MLTEFCRDFGIAVPGPELGQQVVEHAWVVLGRNVWGYVAVASRDPDIVAWLGRCQRVAPDRPYWVLTWDQYLALVQRWRHRRD